MIALNLPETFLQVLDRMYDNHKPHPPPHRRRRQFQSRTDDRRSLRRIQKKNKKKSNGNNLNLDCASHGWNTSNSNNKMNFSSMKLFDRFRRIVMRFIIFAAVPAEQTARSGSRETAEPPKTSCSSSSCNYYYSSSSHYSEAVADCIEFFNKSSSSSSSR